MKGSFITRTTMMQRIRPHFFSSLIFRRQAVTSDELYGYMTLAKEWKDGVLSIIMRNMSKEWAPFGPHQDMKWVILDGDIDAVWIESMNTVMDDNKVRHNKKQIHAVLGVGELTRNRELSPTNPVFLPQTDEFCNGAGMLDSDCSSLRTRPLGNLRAVST